MSILPTTRLTSPAPARSFFAGCGVFTRGQVPQHDAGQQEDPVYTEVVFLLKTAWLLEDVPWDQVERVVQNQIDLMLLTTPFQFNEEEEPRVKAATPPSP